MGPRHVPFEISCGEVSIQVGKVYDVCGCCT